MNIKLKQNSKRCISKNNVSEFFAFNSNYGDVKVGRVNSFLESLLSSIRSQPKGINNE